MRKLIIISLFLFVLASGCINQDEIHQSDLLSLVSHPESHIGGNITVYSGIATDSEADMLHLYIEASDENNTYKLYLNGTDYTCDKCAITGIVRKLNFCECEYAVCLGAGCMPSESANWTSLELKPRSDCEGKAVVMALGSLVRRTVFRCSEGTERPFYYLQVSSVSDIDK